MTRLYRCDDAEPPQSGRGTFWTMRRESTDYIAQVEAGTPSLPPSQLYEAEVTIGDSLSEPPIDDALAHAEGVPIRTALPQLRDALRARAEQEGCEWAQFVTRDGRSWHGAMLYLGDVPSPMRRVPSDS